MGKEPLEALFARYAETGDEAASRELVARTRPRLLAAARRIGNPADAEDSVQTAYLSLLHKRDTAFDAPILPWLMTATVRIAYRAKAKRERLRHIAEQLGRTTPAEASEDAVADAEDARLLRTRVADLPRSLRDPVVLHYFQGLSTGEVGQLLGVSPNAVKKRLQRARGILRVKLHPRLTAGLLAIPWWLTDHAAAAILGGLAVKKTATVATALVVLAAVTGGLVWRAQSRVSEDPPARAEAVAPKDRTDAAPKGQRAEPETTPRAAPDRGNVGKVVYPDGRPAAGAVVWRSAYHLTTGQRMAMEIREGHPYATADGRGEFKLVEKKFDGLVSIEYSARAEGYAYSEARAAPGKPVRIVLAKGAMLRTSARAPNGTPLDKAVFQIYREFRGSTFGLSLKNYAMALGSPPDRPKRSDRSAGTTGAAAASAAPTAAHTQRASAPVVTSDNASVNSSGASEAGTPPAYPRA